MKKTALLIFSFYLLFSFNLFSEKNETTETAEIEKTEKPAETTETAKTETADTEKPPATETEKLTETIEKTEKPETAKTETTETAKPTKTAETEKAEKTEKAEIPKKSTSSLKKITINSAQYTEYKKIPSAPYSEDDLQTNKNDELIIFTGFVSISVSDENSTSTIKADKVIHNKTREALTAVGNVFFERKIGSTEGESFTGDYLIFNIKKLEGVFLDGVIEQATTKKGRDPFRIHTSTAGRNESGVIAFKDGLLTTSKEDDPLWSIRASRIWILPGGEVAFANGFLSVGIVPLFYIPFFYYPSDEMIVHPVFGYRNREGAFVQTTTYLYGRKPAPKTNDETSFSNFMQTDTLKEQKLEGLFFKKLEEPASRQTSSYLKLITDIYSRLGFMVGLDGKFSPKTEYIKKIDFYTFFGFSTTLYPMQILGENGLKYSVYNNLGKKNKDKANFFGLKVPFRYSLNFQMDMGKSPFNVSLSFPFVSDPYFKKDFMGRSEDMNWIKYFLDKDKLAKAEGPSTESNYSWKINGSIRPSFPKIRPWINSISIDKIQTNLNFQAKKNTELTGQELQYAPDRDFFHPKNFSPEIKISMNGNLFSTSMLTKKNKATRKTELDGIKNPFDEEFAKNLEEAFAKNAFENDKTKSVDKTIEAKPTTKEAKEEDNFAFSFIPIYKLKPPKTYSWDSLVDYVLGYKLNLTGLKDLVFDYKEWNKPQDIKWKEIYSDFYKLNGGIEINSKFSFNKNFLQVNNAFDFKGNYQKHKKVKNTIDKEKLELNNYKANVYTVTNTNSIKISPFVFTKMFSPIYAEWKISEKIIQNKFIGSYDNPKWEVEKAKWEKEYITAHSFSAGFGFVFNNYTQLLKSTANLPPLLQAYSFNGSFSFPYTKMELSSKLFEKEKAQKKWFWSPFNASLKFSFPHSITLNQSYRYNIEEKASELYSLSFGWKSISSSFNMAREIPQKLDKIAGWIPKSKEKKFLPKSLIFNISNSAFPIEIYRWKNRIKLNLSFSSSINFNLIRITDSYFTFNTNLSFKINEFWDISFSSLSRNDSIARYFQGSMNLPIEIPGETNVIKDLASSFYFWDRQARLKSGFKLKSLSFSVKHYLKDWIMQLDYSVKPVIKTEGSRKYYSLVPTIKFMVQWQPIGDIKIQTKTEDKEFTVDRGEIK